MSSFDLFLSYNWRDAKAVEDLARRLKARGLRVFLDRWYLTAGTFWVEELEHRLADCHAFATILGPHGPGPWQARETAVALARRVREPAFPVIPVLLPGSEPPRGFLEILTWVDARGGFDDANLDALIAVAKGLPLGDEAALRSAAAHAAVCPYVGLRRFGEEDAPFFFGREAAVEKLFDRLGRRPLVAVLGASGSGKSSVVLAGLLPRLRTRADGKVWEIVTLVPRDRPLRSLAAALLPLLGEPESEVDRLREIDKLADDLRGSPDRLRDVAERALEKQRGTDRLLVVVDQWEELYTLCADDAEREQFIDTVLAATARGPVSVVLTVRYDFYGRLADHRPLIDRLADAEVHLGPMTRDEISRVVHAPAKKVGLEFEQGLADRIVESVTGNPGSLPLMEFCLRELWSARQRNVMLHEAYNAMNGVTGAVAQHVEGWYIALPDDSTRDAARRLFVQHLVRPGKETADTRRRAYMDELSPELRDLVDELSHPERRLLVISFDESTGRRTVEVVHEALIGGWRRLGDWLDKDREFRLWHERLRFAVEEWNRRKRTESTLLRDDALEEARRQIASRRDDLSEEEREFVEASEALQHRLLESERQRLDAERQRLQAEHQRLQVDRRRRRRNRLTLAAAAVVMTGLTVGGWWFWKAEVASRQLELIKSSQDPSARLDALAWIGEHRTVKREEKAREAFKNREPLEIFERLGHAVNPTAVAAAADLVSPVVEAGSKEDIPLVASMVWALDFVSATPEADCKNCGEVRARLVAKLPDRVDLRDLFSARAFVKIDGGPFKMGTEGAGVDSSERQHPVTLKTFWILAHEVTLREYRRFAPDHEMDTTDESLPVVGVSWYEAYAYAAWLGPDCRLPTEAEWEYAARQKCEHEYCDRNGNETTLGEVGRYFSNSDRHIWPVKSREPSPVGLYDVYGNAWEWVADWYGAYPSEPTTDPWDPPSPISQPWLGDSRVLRGGSWRGNASYARAAYRDGTPPANRDDDVGFRVVCSSPISQ